MKRILSFLVLSLLCCHVATAQEKRQTQGLLTETTTTTYTTVTQTKQVRMSKEEWAELKRQRREKRQATADSLRAVRLANMEQQRLAREERLANRPSLVESVGWKNSININVADAGEVDVCPSIGIEYIGGKRFNNTLFVGFGTGIVFNTDSGYTLSVEYDSMNYYDGFDAPLPIVSIPLYGNMRVYITRTRVQPYLSLSTGFRFSTKKKVYADFAGTSHDKFFKHGTTQYFIIPGLGVDFRTNSGSAISLQLSCNLMTVPTIYTRLGYNLRVGIQHKMQAGYHLQIGFTF